MKDMKNNWCENVQHFDAKSADLLLLLPRVLPCCGDLCPLGPMTRHNLCMCFCIFVVDSK